MLCLLQTVPTISMCLFNVDRNTIGRLEYLRLSHHYAHRGVLHYSKLFQQSGISDCSCSSGIQKPSFCEVSMSWLMPCDVSA